MDMVTEMWQRVSSRLTIYTLIPRQEDTAQSMFNNNHSTVHNSCFPQFILDPVGAKGAESQGQHPNMVKITNTNASC